VERVCRLSNPIAVIGIYPFERWAFGRMGKTTR
jgi:hypothetical protein